MNGTATRPPATKYRFAALGQEIFLIPAKRGLLASAPYSRAIHGMVPFMALPRLRRVQ